MEELVMIIPYQIPLVPLNYINLFLVCAMTTIEGVMMGSERLSINITEVAITITVRTRSLVFSPSLGEAKKGLMR